MAHTEFNKVEFKNEINIIKNIKNLEDPFSRNIKLKKVKIDNTFPRYLRENDEIYKDWILK